MFWRRKKGKGIRFTGGAGDSLADAVKIEGAQLGRLASVERVYLSTRFGQQGIAWKWKGQALLVPSGRHYDEIRIELADGTRKKVYFDISDYFFPLV